MRISQPEIVTRSYCDDCGKDVTRETCHGYDDQIHCSTCYTKYWRTNQEKKQKQMRNEKIESQPFY